MAQSHSNIFETLVTSTTAGNSEPTSAETTAAGKLIDHLKFIADQAIATAAIRADWLSVSAKAGQNTDANSLVKKELLRPSLLTRAGALSSWALPQISANPLSLPNLPDHLKVDYQKIKTDAAADLSALQGSWMARYLPEVTDVSSLNSLITNVLNGSQQTVAAAKLVALEADLKAALTAATSAAKTRLESAIVTAKANLVTNFANSKTGAADALAVAKDNTANIAWTRARDQAAREAARLEAESVSAWASRGFSLPGGALTTQAQKSRQAVQNAASDMAAQQAEKSQQLFFDVARATVDLWLRAMDSQSNAEIAGYRTIVETEIKYAELSVEADRAKAKQAFDHLALTLDFTKFAADTAAKYRMGVMEGMNNLIRAYAGLRDNETGYVASIAQAQTKAQDAVLDYYKAAMAAAEIGMRVDITNTETDLRWATIAAQFIGTAVGHHVQAAATSAEVFSRTAGMALSGLNGIASVSASA